MREKFQTTESIHAGRCIKRLREMLGIKQEALALALGPQWNQQRVSLLEKRRNVDFELLEQVADALGVSINTLVNLDPESVMAIITGKGNERNELLYFDPFQKWMESMKENRKLVRKLLRAKDKLIKCLERSSRSSGE